jgi:hypothetical protein
LCSGNGRPPPRTPPVLIPAMMPAAVPAQILPRPAPGEHQARMRGRRERRCGSSALCRCAARAAVPGGRRRIRAPTNLVTSPAAAASISLPDEIETGAPKVVMLKKTKKKKKLQERDVPAPCPVVAGRVMRLVCFPIRSLMLVNAVTTPITRVNFQWTY